MAAAVKGDELDSGVVVPEHVIDADPGSFRLRYRVLGGACRRSARTRLVRRSIRAVSDLTGRDAITNSHKSLRGNRWTKPPAAASGTSFSRRGRTFRLMTAAELLGMTLGVREAGS
jgi:hypothetical protein